MAPSPPTAARLRDAFDSTGSLTIGLEEEAMLLDRETLDLLPRAADVLARTDGDARFTAEMPAAQLEVLTPPAPDVPTAIAALGAGRRDLAATAASFGRLAAAAVHPFAAPLGELNDAPDYAEIARAYGVIARTQLLGALQVHVAVGGADRSLAVYNALRGHLPDIAALAAAAPLLAGRDTGLASVRPMIAQLLPRQGIPPALASWDEFAEALHWRATAGTIPHAGSWWWELRPHARLGTLEVRVPDAQARLADAGAIAAVVHALTAWLAARHAAGDRLPDVPTWRIEENRWSACRDGVEGTMADLETGERRPTRDRLHALLDAIGPHARELGCAAELDAARSLVAENGAMRQRAAFARGGPRAVAEWLADAYMGAA